MKENPKTIVVHVEMEFELKDSFEAASEHEEQEPIALEALEIHQLSHLTRRLGWHSNYVMENNVAYCLLIEDGKPTTLQEAIYNSDASQWMTVIQEEIEALHKNKI